MWSFKGGLGQACRVGLVSVDLSQSSSWFKVRGSCQFSLSVRSFLSHFKLKAIAIIYQHRQLHLFLLRSLFRFSSFSVKNLHVVCCFDRNTMPTCISIIKRFGYTICIISIYSSILHQLNICLIPQASRACLRSIGHYGNLLHRILISDGNGWSNWIEIACYVFSFDKFKFLSFP